MPKNSAQRAGRLPILPASGSPCARADTTPSVSPGVFAGDARSVIAFVENRLVQSRLVVETERRDDGPVRVHRANQSPPFQRHPDRRITQAGGVASCDD